MKKILHHPITRIILGLLTCLIVFIITQNIAGKVLELIGTGKNLRNLVKGILASVAVISTYRLFFKWIEERVVTELSTENIVKNLAIGTAIGLTIQCLTILVIYIYHGFKIISVNPVSFIIIPLAVAFTVAIFEEVLMRGIVFRILEEKLGSYIALGISALIFGALHLANPNATLGSAICISIEAGLLLGAAYIYSRSLWLPIAIHFAWNFIQSGIFGAITSGNEKTSSLLTMQLSGPQLITGGKFGPEGTIQATVFCLLATGIFKYLNIKNNKMIQCQVWKK
ncbi:MAG: type II CAAX endopeptidase family protein [Bacteroidota bacterium]